jgi:hypothetical protein
MKQRSLGLKWYLRACPVCQGDLHDDPEDAGWVTCFMCTRSFRASEVLGRLEPVGAGRRAAATPPATGEPEEMEQKAA